MKPRLFSFELRWTDAAFDAIYPDGTALPHGVKSLHPARFFDDLLADVPLEQHLGLRVALWIVALAPLFVIGKLATIASLESADDRERVVAALTSHRIYAVRGLCMGLKAMAALLYVQSPAVRQAMMVPNGGRPALTQLRSSGTRKITETTKTDAEHDHAAE